MTKKIFCLMGPTASGKTDLACALTTRLPLEIVSVDSALIYREMNIGTAKPNAEILEKYPHHLVDRLDPPESYSAAQFCHDALKLTEAIYQRGKIPLLVGGTMMYFNALQKGLAVLPESDPATRTSILDKASRYGWEYLHEELTRIDPLAANRIHPNDRQRIQRALEVFALTGQALSSFETLAPSNTEYSFVNLILFPHDRSILHRRIAERFQTMLDLGFVAEVAELLQKWQLPETCPAMRAVGYRQVIQYLGGAYDYSELQARGIAATRQLAKRQLTWLRSWLGAPHARFFPCEEEVEGGLLDVLEQAIRAEIDEPGNLCENLP